MDAAAARSDAAADEPGPGQDGPGPDAADADAATAKDATLEDAATDSGPDALAATDSAATNSGLDADSTGPIAVQWAEPAAGTTLQGKVLFRFVGHGFLNVEIKRDGTTIATCVVASDGKSAQAEVDTTQFPSGALTLTAHAWDALPKQAFRYEADAGARTLMIDNPSSPMVLQPYAATSHWNERAKFATLRAGGLQMIRMDISWDHVEASQGSFEWSNVDAAMDEAARTGLQVLAVLSYTNAWASSGNGMPGEVHQYAPLETHDAAWGNYVEQVVRRYGDRVVAWEIWNEPDHDNFLRMASGTWAYNHYPAESAVNKKRLEYKHLLEIALAQPALQGKQLTTSGLAEGGNYDAGFRAWLQAQNGFLNRFGVASFHCYGYPLYQRLIDVPASYRATQSSIGQARWPFWITEHGINTPGVAATTVKTYLIRSFAVALAQPGVEKLFWFRAGYDPMHMDLLDAAGNTTDAYAALKTLSSMWSTPVRVVAWAAASSARGSIASLANGKRIAIVWNDAGAVALTSLGLSFSAAYDQNGNALASDAALTAAPAFLVLAD
jgi:hypothetical protein